MTFPNNCKRQTKVPSNSKHQKAPLSVVVRERKARESFLIAHGIKLRGRSRGQKMEASAVRSSSKSKAVRSQGYYYCWCKCKVITHCHTLPLGSTHTSYSYFKSPTILLVAQWVFEIISLEIECNLIVTLGVALKQYVSYGLAQPENGIRCRRRRCCKRAV